ncbi:MAG: hypothetical protein M1824_003503 [Vezdaea acicularis]|nr:MAG: hypothetical protein M1824_003503 [Vezdaea acicularis]
MTDFHVIQSSNPYCLYDVPGFGTGCFASNALTNSSSSQNISSISSITSATSVTSMASLALATSTPLSTTLSSSLTALPPPTTAKATTTSSSSSGSSSSYSAIEWTSAIATILCYDPLGIAWTPCPPSFLATFRPSGTATPSAKRSAASGPLAPNLGKSVMALYSATLMLVYYTSGWLQELWAADMNLYGGDAGDGDLEPSSDRSDGYDGQDGGSDGGRTGGPPYQYHGNLDDGNSDHHSPSKWPYPRLDVCGHHGTEPLHDCASTSNSDHHPLQHAHPSSSRQYHKESHNEASDVTIRKVHMPAPPTTA